MPTLRTFLLLLPFLLQALPLAATPLSFRLTIDQEGVYKVTYAELAAHGWPAGIGTSSISMTLSGEAVPLWIEDGGDGRFDGQDWIEFVGRHRAGEHSYFNPHSPWNVYFLRAEAGSDGSRQTEPSTSAVAQGLRMRSTAAETAETSSPATPPAYRRRLHLEEDLLLLRLPSNQSTQETWFWQRLTQIDPEPYSMPLDLADLRATSDETATLRVHFRGWSRPAYELAAGEPHHRVEVSWRDGLVGVAEWSGQEEDLFEVELSAAELERGLNTLTFQVPKRQMANGDPLIDVVMLNWVELDYPRDRSVHPGQTRVTLPTDHSGAWTLEGPEADDSLLVYSDEGTRLVLPLPAAVTGKVTPPFLLPTAARVMDVVSEGGYYRAHAIELDKPSNLATSDLQADYIMIAHSSLLEATKPLAQFHRRRGLTVALVDVQDVYDEFDHGLVGPQPIRDFIDHAFHHWQPPAPRFVLLVGDASWQTKGTPNDASYADWAHQPWETMRFVKNPSTPYEAPVIAPRNLIPTGNSTTPQGHAASDNWFVAVDGDDFYPDLAIGRLPVVEPAEVAAIVKKTIRYASNPPLGPWRRNLLWITNEEEQLQQQSDSLAALAGAEGFESMKVYPQAQEAGNELHQEELRHAFDEGQLLVHFLGHGGRYIWRTGPPDPDKNHDLFTLEDLDQLHSTRRLPVVLSLTCYSAPFDHPLADSIGEKFLRLEDAGAIAVFAASWRNKPTLHLSRSLLEELRKPSPTLGEAIVAVKKGLRNRVLVETYNLLGDPALELAVPSLPIAVELIADDSISTAAAEIAAPQFRGRVVVDWLDEAGNVLESARKRVSSPRFQLQVSHRLLAAPVAAVRVYAWDPSRRVDGIGYASLHPRRTAEQKRVDRQSASARQTKKR